MVRESKRLEVLQLLKDYRAYHTPYGGAMVLEDTHVCEASYGPAGFIEAGMEYTKEQREDLAESYSYLEHAICIMKAENQLGFVCWLMLLAPYLGSDADPSIVREWERRGDHRKEYHDKAVTRLAELLDGVALYPVWPKRMSGMEEKQVERRNKELVGVYNTLRAEGKIKSVAVEDAATICGYSTGRAWEIVRLHEPSEARAK